MVDRHEPDDADLQVVEPGPVRPDRGIGHEANVLPADAAADGELERLSLVAGGRDPDGGSSAGWSAVRKHLDDGRHLPDLHALLRIRAGAGSERLMALVTSTTTTASCQTVPDWSIVR